MVGDSIQYCTTVRRMAEERMAEDFIWCGTTISRALEDTVTKEVNRIYMPEGMILVLGAMDKAAMENADQVYMPEEEALLEQATDNIATDEASRQGAPGERALYKKAPEENVLDDWKLANGMTDGCTEMIGSCPDSGESQPTAPGLEASSAYNYQWVAPKELCVYFLLKNFACI